MPTLIPSIATGSHFTRMQREVWTEYLLSSCSSDKDVRFSNPYSFLARQKDVIEQLFRRCCYLFDTGNFKIMIRLPKGKILFYRYSKLSPEIFKEVVNKDPWKQSSLRRGLMQLTDEGVAQLFTQLVAPRRSLVVGELQFEVIQYRLMQEYGASVNRWTVCHFTKPAG